MENILEKLRQKGYKITPQRRAVLDAFQAFETFPTAQQLLTAVRKTHPDVSLDTIYRNLSLLTKSAAHRGMYMSWQPAGITIIIWYAPNAAKQNALICARFQMRTLRKPKKKDFLSPDTSSNFTVCAAIAAKRKIIIDSTAFQEGAAH